MHDEVFVDASIDKRLHTEFVPVLVDATEMTPDISALIKKYRVSTLPTVVFLNSKGQLLNDQSLVGFTNVEALDAQLSQVIQLTSRP